MPDRLAWYSYRSITPVLFAFGELYCYAVVFGYRRVIFATRVLWRIEYHCEAKPNNITARRAISLFAKQRISLIKMQKRESFTELYFRITLSSVFIASFAFVKQIHRAMPIPLLKFSDKDYTHCAIAFFFMPRFCAADRLPHSAYSQWRCRSLPWGLRPARGWVHRRACRHACGQ